MTELDKLKTASEMIRDVSEGRLQVATSVGNNIYVKAKDDAYIGMDMMIRGNVQQKCYEITFDASVRRMGTPMTAADLGKLAREVQQAQSLLTALEIYSFRPTQADMVQFYDHLLEQRQSPSEPKPMRSTLDMQPM